MTNTVRCSLTCFWCHCLLVHFCSRVDIHREIWSWVHGRNSLNVRFRTSEGIMYNFTWPVPWFSLFVGNSYLSIVIETFGCSMKMYDLYVRLPCAHECSIANLWGSSMGQFGSIWDPHARIPIRQSSLYASLIFLLAWLTAAKRRLLNALKFSGLSLTLMNDRRIIRWRGVLLPLV